MELLHVNHVIKSGIRFGWNVYVSAAADFVCGDFVFFLYVEGLI